ncbi:MAG: TatD family hydrolase, partial [Myxococcota bacterium]
AWIQGGVGPDDWLRQLDLRARLGDAVRLAFGVHPWWAAAASDDELDRALDQLAGELGRADALGELGLDRHPRWRKRDGALARQTRALTAQLELARRVPRPLVLHVVRAHDPVLAELERHAPFPRGGLVHAFTGRLHHARRYIELGFHLSLGGALAARPERARELAEIPADRVVIETDAPDQAPRAWQVEYNEPAYLLRIAAVLAPVWGLSAADLLDRSHAAVEALFSS